jgi:hypothetical protein
LGAQEVVFVIFEKAQRKKHFQKIPPENTNHQQQHNNQPPNSPQPHSPQQALLIPLPSTWLARTEREREIVSEHQ